MPNTIRDPERAKGKYWALLAGAVPLYSLSVIFQKYAAIHAVFSLNFFLFYALSLLMLVVYALFWQQILRGLPLSVAYCARALTIVITLAAGAVLFGETISATKLIGAAVIVAGVILAVSSHE